MLRILAVLLLALAGSVASASADEHQEMIWIDPSVPTVPTPTRGALLPTLYVSLAGLHAFDAYSTSQGLSRGARETNPLMRGAGGNAVAIWTIKAGGAGASIALAERLWREDRRGQAIALMVITNGMMAAVAARNASVLRQQSR